MKKLLKLGILITLSLSVYLIYNQTKDKNITIMVLGDGLSEGINSYGIYDYSYVDYYKDYLEDKTVEINKKYCQKDLTIQRLLEKLKMYPELKKDLREANILFLNVGYVDLIYKLSLEENTIETTFSKDMKELEENYQELIKEIRRYYRKHIITIGYYASNKDDYYLNKGIKELNHIYEKEQENIYIDTYNLLNDQKKYFSNPYSYYPNALAHYEIAKKIMEKTLENS